MKKNSNFWESACPRLPCAKSSAGFVITQSYHIAPQFRPADDAASQDFKPNSQYSSFQVLSGPFTDQHSVGLVCPSRVGQSERRRQIHPRLPGCWGCHCIIDSWFLSARCCISNAQGMYMPVFRRHVLRFPTSDASPNLEQTSFWRLCFCAC